VSRRLMGTRLEVRALTRNKNLDVSSPVGR
jgi:hypothetical protein